MINMLLLGSLYQSNIYKRWHQNDYIIMRKNIHVSGQYGRVRCSCTQVETKRCGASSEQLADTCVTLRVPFVGLSTHVFIYRQSYL